MTYFFLKLFLTGLMMVFIAWSAIYVTDKLTRRPSRVTMAWQVFLFIGGCLAVVVGAFGLVWSIG